jgi:hypothetical protein
VKKTNELVKLDVVNEVNVELTGMIKMNDDADENWNDGIMTADRLIVLSGRINEWIVRIAQSVQSAHLQIVAVKKTGVKSHEVTPKSLQGQSRSKR